MHATPSLIRIAVVEDHALFAEALEVALTLDGHDVTRPAVTEQSLGSGRLLAGLLRLRPRVVLLDLDLGASGDGAPLIDPLTQSGMSVVVVTASEDRARWGECLRRGAATVLDKTTALSSILATIRLVADGRQVMPREQREGLLELSRHERLELADLHRKVALLTAREREVLSHLMDGTTVRKIAQLSYVSEATVRTQVKSILAKLDVSSQLAAVGAAHRMGWVPPRTSRLRA